MLQSALALFLLSLIVRQPWFHTQSFVYATASGKLLLEALVVWYNPLQIPERSNSSFMPQVLVGVPLLLLPRLHSYFRIVLRRLVELVFCALRISFNAASIFYCFSAIAHFFMFYCSLISFIKELVPPVVPVLVIYCVKKAIPKPTW
jgi:hypothetical protein